MSDNLVVDTSPVATEIVRMQIARIDVLDVQRSDLELLHTAATAQAAHQGWFLFCLGLLIPTILTAAVTDWAAVAAYVPGVYVGAIVALALGSLVTGSQWRQSRATADEKYKSIVGQATVEVRNPRRGA